MSPTSPATRDLDSRFLTAAAFRFEAARGAHQSSFETECIAAADLATVLPDALARTLWDWLATAGADSPLRGSAYWALGKRGDPRDLMPLVAALRRELTRDPEATYQIMIALANLGEPVFPPHQREHSSRDGETNRTAAESYLAQRQCIGQVSTLAT